MSVYMISIDILHPQFGSTCFGAHSCASLMAFVVTVITILLPHNNSCSTSYFLLVYCCFWHFAVANSSVVKILAHVSLCEHVSTVPMEVSHGVLCTRTIFLFYY